MPRRKAAKAELLPPEEDQPLQSRQKVVEVKHKTEWSEIRPVEEAPEDTELDPADDDVIEERPRRRTSKNERDELRKKLAQNNVTPGSQLKLTIEKYPHSEATDGNGGSWAGADYCTKYPCTEAHITNEDYLDVARKWGAGLYRFTLRMQNKIVTAWDKRINAAPTGPVIQNVNPADPNSPQVIFQTNDSQQAMPSLKDVWRAQREALKEQLEMAKLMREAYGLESDKSDKATTTGATSDPEIAFVSNLLTHNEKAMEKISNGVLGKLFGKNAIEDDPSWSAVGMEAVKSGQLGIAIDAAFRGLAGLVNMILPRRDNNNGQAEMGTPPLQTPHMDNSQRPQQPHHEVQGTMPQAQLQGASSVVETGSNAAPGQQITPAEQALATVISDCQKKIPPQITFTNLMTFADAINDQAPAYSIDGWIEYFGGMPIDGALEFVKTLPNGEQIASLPHAKEWTEQLQKLIKDSQEGEEE